MDDARQNLICVIAAIIAVSVAAVETVSAINRFSRLLMQPSTQSMLLSSWALVKITHSGGVESFSLAATDLTHIQCIDVWMALSYNYGSKFKCIRRENTLQGHQT